MIPTAKNIIEKARIDSGIEVFETSKKGLKMSEFFPISKYETIVNIKNNKINTIPKYIKNLQKKPVLKSDLAEKYLFLTIEINYPK